MYLYGVKNDVTKINSWKLLVLSMLKIIWKSEFRGHIIYDLYLGNS